MTEAAAADVVKSWGVGAALAGPTGVVGWLAANVGIIVGQRTGSTHFFEACRWRERECVVTVPADRTYHAGSRVAFHLALVEVLETHNLYGTVLSSHICCTGQHLAGYQSGWALDPRRAVHRAVGARPPVPAGRTTTPERPPATPSPATGIDIDIRRAGIERAVAENTTTIADQPTEEPVVSRTVRRACMTVRLFDKPRSRRC